jgi:aryl-alcohol dehydrogenase
MKTLAAVAREHGRPLTIEELDLDDLRPGEVRVRLVASGICHTDAIVRDGVYPTPLPAVLGHEGSGVVEAVGPGVTTCAVGDHVILGAAYCGKCDMCRSGLPTYCEFTFAQCFGGSRSDGSKSFSKDGEAISSHFFGQSSFAHHVNAVENSVVVVPKDIDLELLGPLGCGFNTGAGAVLNEMRPAAGTSLAVFGSGAVGMAGLMAARVAGCTKIVAIDIHDSRLRTAAELGATHTVNSRTADVVAELRSITGGKGVDFALDTTGLPALLLQAADALAVRGMLVQVGAPAGGTTVPFEVGLSLLKGWTFRTVIEGSSVSQVFLPRLIELWQQGRFPFDKLVRTYAFAEINTGFADSASGEVVKPVVVY